MTDTDTTVATIETEGETTEVAIGDLSNSTDTLEGEVISDEVETEAPAKPKRKSRTVRNSEANGQAAVQEVAPPAPVAEKSSFTPAKAAKLTDKLISTVQQSTALFIEAYEGRIWLALDYPTWAEYLNGELGDDRPRLPKAKRLEWVAELKVGAKMSQSAIAATLGMDQKTVSNDLKEIKAAAAESGEEAPASESVGQDGRERTITSNNRAAKPFADRVSAKFTKLLTAWGDIVELRVEEEWGEEVKSISSRHRGDLLRLAAEIDVMVGQLPIVIEDASEDDDGEEDTDTEE